LSAAQPAVSLVQDLQHTTNQMLKEAHEPIVAPVKNQPDGHSHATFNMTHSTAPYAPIHPFLRSGLAARSDLDSPEWRELYQSLELEQERFLAHEGQFRSPEYLWPRDSLHNWSRIWEYPYVYYHLRSFKASWKSPNLPLAIDFGSGVTFLSFAIARLGYEVICCDHDPICTRDMDRAIASVEHGPGKMASTLTRGTRLPLPDARADVIVCVSVLEHIKRFEDVVAEFARVLKPGGMLLLTIDLDLGGNLEIGVEGYQRLLSRLREQFIPIHPEVTVHPRDVLTSLEGPYRLMPPGGLRKWTSMLKQNWLKPILGRKPSPLVPILAVQSLTLQRLKS
jgi:SAM-dependent methyltransferase